MPHDVTPWWKALKIRNEILDASGQIDDVQMSLFRAVYSTATDRPPYSDAGYYSEITYPGERLIDLLAEIAVRVGSGSDYLKARAVTRLDQGMGGGKSHACIGAYHLAADPDVFLRTRLGQLVASRAKAKTGQTLRADLNHPHVVVLPCDNMTPGAPVKEHDGPSVNLYERFLWRLVSKDYVLFERYQPFWSDKSKIAEAIRAVNRPVLIIIDEILDYVGNGLEGANRPDLAAQDMAFLRALLDVANDVPNVALLTVMIASDADKTALPSPAARERRDDLDALLSKNGLPATVTEVADFASILRRRLFDSDPASEVLTATAAMFRPSLDDKSWTKNVWDPIFADWRQRWDEHVALCYPFHPMLMAMAKEEWSKVTGFQRVRSTIRIFAATVFALQQRGRTGEWVPALIGPGDLPLSDSAVREALLGSGLAEDERTISNYRSLAEIEVVNNDGTGGTARKQDLLRDPATGWSAANPRAAERAATYVFLASIVGTLRPGRGRGASAPEVKAATGVPELAYTVTDADEVVDTLMNPDRGMTAIEPIPGQGNNKPARYFLSTRLTHRMLVTNIRRTITESEREEVIASTAQRLSSSGPFRDLRFVNADLKRTPSDVLATAGLDTAYMTRLIVLDPTQFSLRNGAEDETLDALRVAMGLGSGTSQISVQWASSAVFVVINTQRRALTRNMAVEYLARRKALAAPEVQNDAELKQTGTRELAEAKNKLEGHLKRAYQHVVYLAQPDPDGERLLQEVTFDDEHSSALDGTIVWKALAERDKVFDGGQFTARALVHNLRDSDYGKTLSDIRAAFYSAPRLPLLFNGDRDLQQAIYDAVAEDMTVIVDGSGQAVAVTASSHVNLSSTGLRLAKPEPAQASSTSGVPGQTSGASGGQTSASTPTATPAGTDPASSPAPVPAATERQVSFSLTQNLLSSQSAADDLASLFKALYTAVDERDISYVQTTVQLVASAAMADDLKQRLGEMGVQATTKDM